jgi:hypothetical protein
VDLYQTHILTVQKITLSKSRWFRLWNTSKYEKINVLVYKILIRKCYERRPLVKPRQRSILLACIWRETVPPRERLILDSYPELRTALSGSGRTGPTVDIPVTVTHHVT